MVYTGDTGPSKALEKLAEGCDVLIHMCSHISGSVDNPATRAGTSGHLEAARAAAAAGARCLVASHIYDQFDRPGVRERVIAEMARIYDGVIVLGEDLMELSLPPRRRQAYSVSNDRGLRRIGKEAEMTIGVGGSSDEAELAAMRSLRGDAPVIGVDERIAARRARAGFDARKGHRCALARRLEQPDLFHGPQDAQNRAAASGAVLPASGDMVYVSPVFEVEKLRDHEFTAGDKVVAWEEREDPTELVTETIRSLGAARGTVAIDEATPFFTFDGLRRAGNSYTFVNAIEITGACRSIKSEREVALMQTAKTITLEVQKAAARIMREGITTTEVLAFLAAAHVKLGADGPPPAGGIVLFGEATAYPHGVPYPQTLKDGDMVLIETSGRRSMGICRTSRAPTCSEGRRRVSANVEP